MIDLNWIASQPKPVAIHCPSYYDAVAVLTAINPHLRPERRAGTSSEIESRAKVLFKAYGEELCIRVGYRHYSDIADKYIATGQSDRKFYESNLNYILVEFGQVLVQACDFGEIDADISELSTLFGEEGRHGDYVI